MPGIVGLVTKLPREIAEPQLLRMVETIRHHSSYVAGTWIDERAGIYVGWAARKNSFSSEMPLRNERGDVVLAFAGEEYPEPGFAKQLKERGHVFDADGPSYLVHACEEDPTFPSELNGRFHGLLVDKARGTATLFNDRYGMHRVYFHESTDGFYFAAEAKAILAVRPELRKVDPRGLGEFVACGCVLENRTLFDRVYLLPPASAWRFRNGSIQQKTSYFQANEWEQQTPLEPEEYYQELKGIFSKNLPRYFAGPEKIGMSLTGGLDTRMIMAWDKPSQGSLPCYSFGGTVRDCQDVVMARRIAEACKQPYSVIRVGKDFISCFPKYAERAVYLTDGSISVNHASDLYLNERAAEIAPARMTGNYGGEVLRRVRAFKPSAPSSGLFSPELLGYVSDAGDTYRKVIQTHPLSFAVFRQAPWHHYGLLSLEQTQLTLRSPYLDNQFVKTVFRAPESAVTNNDISLRLIADGDANLRKIRTDRGVGGSGNNFANAISRQFLEFTFKAEYAYDVGMPPWLARTDHNLSALHLERLFLGRHKFCHYRMWYRDGLSNYVREMLLDTRTLSRPYVQRNELERIVRGHLKGDHNYTTAIHKMLTLELIHRLFLDPAPDQIQHQLPSVTIEGRS